MLHSDGKMIYAAVGYFEKLDILFKFEAHEKFYHRHITDISESHSVRLPEDKILSATMKLGKRAIFQSSQDIWRQI